MTKQQRRRIDIASLTLLAISIPSGAFAYTSITYHDTNALVIIPAVVAATLACTNLVKIEATEQEQR